MTESHQLPDLTHPFWNRAKFIVLYVVEKRLQPCPKGWRGQVVRVLHCKAGGATCGAQNAMLLRKMEEGWNLIDLNTWVSRTLSIFLEERVGGNQVQLGIFTPIR